MTENELIVTKEGNVAKNSGTARTGRTALR